MVSDYVRERFSAVSRETRESERAEAGAGGPEHARLDRGRGSRARYLVGEHPTIRLSAQCSEVRA